MVTHHLAQHEVNKVRLGRKPTFLSIECQRGMSMSGFFVLLGMVIGYAVFAFAAFPLVNEYYSVRGIMERMAALPPEDLPRVSDVEKIFIRRADVNSLSNFGESALRENKGRLTVVVDRKTRIKTLHIRYQSQRKLFGNFHLSWRAHESIELGTGQVETVKLPYDEQEEE